MPARDGHRRAAQQTIGAYFRVSAEDETLFQNLLQVAWRLRDAVLLSEYAVRQNEEEKPLRDREAVSEIVQKGPEHVTEISNYDGLCTSQQYGLSQTVQTVLPQPQYSDHNRGSYPNTWWMVCAAF